MPDSPEGQQWAPVPAEDQESDTIEQGRPAEAINRLKEKLANAKPVNLDELLGGIRPDISKVKISDTGEILEDSTTSNK